MSAGASDELCVAIILPVKEGEITALMAYSPKHKQVHNEPNPYFPSFSVDKQKWL